LPVDLVPNYGTDQRNQRLQLEGARISKRYALDVLPRQKDFDWQPLATHQCGICEADCTGTRDIACDICNQWLHFACENLSEQEFIFLKKTSLSYMCYRCLYKDSTYNFYLVLQRLSENIQALRCVGTQWWLIH
jgi:hypothetical protein